MKSRTSLRRLLFASATLAAVNSAQAQLYWDTNGATAGFGTASGTWGSDAFWNNSATGGAGTFSSLTALTDSLNFGNGATGLGAGTITVNGTVDSGNITFASGSGAITLSGGTINFAAASTITVNNSTNIITSAISGAGTSLTKAGTGTLVLGGGGTMAGNLIVSAGTVQLGADNGISTSAGLDIYGEAAASRVLDLNGYDQTLSRFGFSAVNSDGNLTITGGANSTLTINATENSLIGQSGITGTPITPARIVDVDMSGLGEFVWNGGTDYYFEVGPRGLNLTPGANDPGTTTVLLADNNTITGTQIRVGANPLNNHGGTSILRLGQTNILNADTLNIGASSRSNATLNFRNGLSGTPTVTIRGTDGSSAVTTWDVGRVAATGNSAAWTSTVDFSTGEINALVTNLRIGRADTGGATGRSGTVDATFTMGKGTLQVGTLIIGQYVGAGSVGSGQTYRGNGTFTLNDATGIVKAGDIILADNIGTATGGNARTTSGTLNLTAGTLEVISIDRGANTGTATATRNFNFTSGTIRNATGSNLSIANVPLNLTGSGTRFFEATTGQSITVASTSDISGSGQGFTKAGDGTLILQGTKSYTGITSIDAGTLEVQGSVGSSASITNDAALVFNSSSAQSYGNAIGGSGTLTKNGTGTLTISGNNSYTGASFINNGTVILGHNSALGTTDAGATIVGSAFGGTTGTTLNLGSTGLTLSENIHINGNAAGRARLYNNEAVDHVLNGDIDVTSDTGFTQIWSDNSGSITINGGITGTITNGSLFLIRGTSTSANNRILGDLNFSGNLSKTDGGTWLIGAAGKTYSWGNTSVSVGTLRMGAADVLPSTTVVTLGQNSPTAAELDINGFSQTVAGIQLASSPGTGTRTITSATSATLTVGDGNDYSYGGVLTGALALSKAGDGTLTLTGTNTYTGATTVSNGVLRVNGSMDAGSAVTVEANGTLGGNGTINGPLALTGNLAPGQSGVSIQTLNAGTTTWNGGSVWKFDLATIGSTSDKLNITGDFNKGTGSGFKFDFMGATPEWNTTFLLASWTGSTNFTLADFDLAGSIATLGSGSYSTSSFSFTVDGKSLQFTAIPEPGTALGGLLLAAGLLRRRRRHLLR